MSSLCHVQSAAVDGSAVKRRPPAPSADSGVTRSRYPFLSSSSSAAPQKPTASLPKVGAYSPLYLASLHEWNLLATGQQQPQTNASCPSTTKVLTSALENRWWERCSPPESVDCASPLFDSEVSMRQFNSADFCEHLGDNEMHLGELLRRCREAKPMCDLLPQMLELTPSLGTQCLPVSLDKEESCAETPQPTVIPLDAATHCAGVEPHTSTTAAATSRQRTTIAGPSISRRSAGWHSMLLDDVEDEDEQERSVHASKLSRGQTAVSANADLLQSVPPKMHVTADGPLETTAIATTTEEAVELFLLEELRKWWDADHPPSASETGSSSSSWTLESEAQKSKVLPTLVGEALDYLASLVKIRGRASSAALASSSLTAPAAPSSLLLPLPQRYPPPRFSGSPFANETNRFTKWLRTWRNFHHDNGVDTIEEEEENQEPAKRKKAKKNGGNLPSAATPNGSDPPRPKAKCTTVSPTTGRDEFRDSVAAIIETGSFIVDDRGNRLSARIARKEALQRQKDEEEERERQKQRGYFSNDTTDLKHVSIAGGEGAMSNVAVLSGPTGVGKTAAVYAAAQAMGYRVVEINTSLKRTAKSIEKAVAEATQSKQITISAGSSDAGRLELERLAVAAEAKRRASAREAEQRIEAQRRLQAEARERDVKRQADEEKQGQEISAAAARAAARKAAGIKRENGISQAAVSSFFNKIKRSAPPTADAGPAAAGASTAPVVEVVDVEGDCCTKGPSAAVAGSSWNAVPVVDVDGDDETAGEASGSRAKTEAKGSLGRRSEPAPLPSVAAAPVRHEVVDADEPHRLSKRKREATDVPETDYTALPTTIVVVEDGAGVRSPTTPGSSPVQKDAALLPLILIESADVILDDEVQKSIYATIRSLGAETKFPIIVTGNQVGSQLVHHTFGAGTPHAVMSEAPAMYLLLQGLLVTLAERGIATLDATQRYGIQFVGDVATLSEKLRNASSVVQRAWHVVDETCDIRRFLFALQVELCAPHPTTKPTLPRLPSTPDLRCCSWIRDVSLCTVAERTMQLELDAQAAAVAERALQGNDSDNDSNDDGGDAGCHPAAASSSADSDLCHSNSGYDDDGVWLERLSCTPHALLKKQSLNRIVTLQYRSRNASLRTQCMKSQLALSEIVNLLPKILPKPKRGPSDFVNSTV